MRSCLEKWPPSKGGLGLKPSSNRGMSSQNVNNTKRFLQSYEFVQSKLRNIAHIETLRKSVTASPSEKALENICDRFSALEKLPAVMHHMNTAHSVVSHPPCYNTPLQDFDKLANSLKAVSYTHLTLPTILLV